MTTEHNLGFSETSGPPPMMEAVTNLEHLSMNSGRLFTGKYGKCGHDDYPDGKSLKQPEQQEPDGVFAYTVKPPVPLRRPNAHE